MAKKAPAMSLNLMVRQWEDELPDLDLRPFWFVGAVMQLAQRYESDFRDLAQSRFGIGTGDLRIILALRRAGPPYAVRATDLFQSLLITSGAVTKQVDRLEKKGFVERIRAEASRGERLVSLTSKGMRAANFVQKTIATSFAGIGPIVSGLSEKELRTIVTTFQRLLREQPSGDVGDVGWFSTKVRLARASTKTPNKTMC
jgi:DNA-binding MarR family transcriptional regulator